MVLSFHLIKELIKENLSKGAQAVPDVIDSEQTPVSLLLVSRKPEAMTITNSANSSTAPGTINTSTFLVNHLSEDAARPIPPSQPEQDPEWRAKVDNVNVLWHTKL